MFDNAKTRQSIVLFGDYTGKTPGFIVFSLKTHNQTDSFADRGPYTVISGFHVNFPQEFLSPRR